MRHKVVLSCLVTVSLVLGAGLAEAGVIDFESMPVGYLASYTESGVTFTAPGGVVFGLVGPNGTKGLVGREPSGPLYLHRRADIAGGATSVSVDLGDFDQDPDTLFLEIFDSSNASIGFTDLLIDASFEGMKTLSLSAPDIAYAVFGATDPATLGSSVFADNFTFEPASIPEPATLSLLGLGAVGMAMRRRRKR